MNSKECNTDKEDGDNSEIQRPSGEVTSADAASDDEEGATSTVNEEISTAVPVNDDDVESVLLNDVEEQRCAEISHEVEKVLDQEDKSASEEQDTSSVPQPPSKQDRDETQEEMAPRAPGAVFQRRLTASSHGGSVQDAPIVNAELIHDDPVASDSVVLVDAAQPIVEASAIPDRPLPAESRQETYLTLLGKRRVLCLLLVVAVAVAAVVTVTAVVVIGTGESSSDDNPSSIDRAAYVDDDDAGNNNACSQCTAGLEECVEVARNRCFDLQELCEDQCFELDEDEEDKDEEVECLDECRIEADACIIIYTTSVCNLAFDVCEIEYC